MNKRTKIRNLVQIGMLSAIAVVLMLFQFSIPFIAPSFYQLDLSELPVLIGCFAMGPLAGILIEFIKILLNLMIDGTATAFVGEAANFIIGSSFVLPAAMIYRHKKTKKSALLGMVTGSLIMAFVGGVLNAYVLLPAYAAAFQMPIEAFIDMGTAINPSITGIETFVLLSVVPFNLIKGVLVSTLTLLLYKHISPVLKSNRQ